MNAHPTQAEIRSFVAGLDDSGVRDQIRHLLECEKCRTRFREPLGQRLSDLSESGLLHFEGRAESNSVEGWQADPYDRAATAGRQEWDESAALLDELLGHPEGRRRILVRNSQRFHSMALVQRLLERSRIESFDDPRQGEALASLAVDLLAGLDRSFYGERLIRDVLARAWSLVGDAQRLARDFVSAEAALEKGAALLEGSFDPLEEATFLHRVAALRCDQRRHEESMELLETAQLLYEQIQDECNVARILVERGLLHIRLGDPSQGIGPLRQALAIVDPLGDPETALSARHNLAHCLAELGFYPEAEKLFQECIPHYSSFKGPPTQDRIWWLEGLIDAGLGRLEKAEEILTSLRDAYLEDGQIFSAALTSLDLSNLYVRQDRGHALEDVCRELFRDLPGKSAGLSESAEGLRSVKAGEALHEEAVMALAFFRKAVERNEASQELIHRIATFLKRSRYNPELKFDDA